MMHIHQILIWLAFNGAAFQLEMILYHSRTLMASGNQIFFYARENRASRLHPLSLSFFSRFDRKIPQTSFLSIKGK